jgi:tRNA G10  N-methylase Trm11
MCACLDYTKERAMSEFSAKSVCILGRQPTLGLAELESLYGAEHVLPLGGMALLDIDAPDINFKRLGGTIKVARILVTIPGSSWVDIKKYLLENVPKHLQHVPPGKFTLGLSFYGLEAPVTDINRLALDIKKAAKRSMRVVPNKTAVLNSAQVLHNKLTSLGAWELLLIKHGQQTLLAQTFFVQDIEAYGARDQARPKRDARVGMLPPKLAQIIINLAKPEAEKVRLLDPFCGTGVILQEAMLMGYHTLGSDIDPRMVDYTKENLAWLVAQKPKIEAQVSVEVADATTASWPRFSVVASEVYLGRPLNSLPEHGKLDEIIQDVNTITRKFLKNLAGQMKSGQRASLAVPAWKKPDGKFLHLPLLDHLTEMGYNYLDLKHVRSEELLYYREDQVVARQLIRLEKI